MGEPVGPMPGMDNRGIVIECACKGQSFKVSWIVAPVAAAGRRAGIYETDGRFRFLARAGERLSPRYALECLACGAVLLAPPEGPAPEGIRGGVNNN